MNIKSSEIKGEALESAHPRNGKGILKEQSGKKSRKGGEVAEKAGSKSRKEGVG